MLIVKLFLVLLCINQSFGYYATGACLESPTIKDFSAQKVIIHSNDIETLKHR